MNDGKPKDHLRFVNFRLSQHKGVMFSSYTGMSRKISVFNKTVDFLNE